MNTKNGKGMMLFTAARKLCGTASAVLLSLVLSAGPAVAEIIPPGRTAPWQGNVGVPGGIPARTKIYKNIVTDLGADPTGKVDAAPIINSALKSCPAGQVVYMPAGTFKIATPIYAAEQKQFHAERRRTRADDSSRHTTVTPISSRGLTPWPPPSTGPPLRLGQQGAVTRSPSRIRLTLLLTCSSQSTCYSDMGA